MLFAVAELLVSTASHVTFARPWKWRYTLVHAFATSWLDYGNVLLTTCAENCDWQAAAELQCRCPCHHCYTEVRSGLTHILHDELHRLDVPQRVTFKLCMAVYKCLHGLLFWALRASRGRSWSWITPPYKPRTSILSLLQHDKLPQKCIFVRRPSWLELTSLKCAEINIYRNL